MNKQDRKELESIQGELANLKERMENLAQSIQERADNLGSSPLAETQKAQNIQDQADKAQEIVDGFDNLDSEIQEFLEME